MSTQPEMSAEAKGSCSGYFGIPFAKGKVTDTRVPKSSALDIETLPPCAIQIPFTIASPSPAPPDDRERDLSAR